MWRWPRTLSRFFRADDPHETGVRASFLIIMILVVLSQVVGTEAILGAFLAGAAISFMFRGSGALESKLFGFGYGFLIPLFFVRVGVQFSDYVSGEGGLAGLWLVPVFLVLAYVFKVVPSMLHSFEHGTRKSLAAGVLISGGLSLAIAAAEIGTTKEVIGQSTSAAIIFFAIVMAIVSPIVFKRIYTLTLPKVLVEEDEGVVVVAPAGEAAPDDPPAGEDEAITVVPLEGTVKPGVRGR
jgi:Kef-type K+ transport system membrane component KefB